MVFLCLVSLMKPLLGHWIFFFFFLTIKQMPACFLNQFEQQMDAEVHIWMFSHWFAKLVLKGFFIFFFIILRTLVLFTPIHPIVGYFMIWIIYEICVFDATIMRVFN